MSDMMTVVALSGQAWIRDENGSLRELKVGDVIDANSVIVTADGTSLELALANGETALLGGGEMVLASSLFAGAAIANDADGVSQVRDTEAMRDSETDSDRPSPDEGAPSAPQQNTHRSLSSVDSEGSNFVRVQRIEELIDPLQYDYQYVVDDRLETLRGGAGGTAKGGGYADTTEPLQISVALDGAGDDGIYSQDEIGPDGTVTATVTLGGGVQVGDTLVVTDKDGNVLFDEDVTQDHLDNGVAVQVPVQPGDTDVSVTATVTDPAGNTASDDDNKPIDTVPPTVSVALEGAGDDGIYSEDEIVDGEVTAQVTLGDDTEVGDTLVVTDKDGNELLNRPVTQEDLDNGVPVEVPVQPGDTDVSVTATVTDPSGNSEGASDSKPVDNVPPTVSVELQGAGTDDTYSQDEIGDDGTVTAQVTLGSDTEVGDTLVVTDKDGNELWNRPVTQDDLDNGVSVEVSVAPGDTDVSVTATVTDPAGNSDTASDSKPVDNVPPTVTVELQGAGDDGIYSDDEINPNGTVNAQVTLGDDTEVGDTLVVTDKDGNELLTKIVTQDDLDNGVAVQVPVSPGDTNVSVTATVTDPAGNSDTASDNKPIDTVPPAVSVALEGAGDDGIYSDDEINPNGTVTAQVTLEEGTEVGDRLVVTDKCGYELVNRPVTQDDLDSGVAVQVPVSPGDTDVSVTATVIDPAGNTDTDDDSKPIDTVPPAVSVALEGAGDDGIYSAVV